MSGEWLTPDGSGFSAFAMVACVVEEHPSAHVTYTTHLVNVPGGSVAQPSVTCTITTSQPGFSTWCKTHSKYYSFRPVGSATKTHSVGVGH
jgi:hypothetical protein